MSERDDARSPNPEGFTPGLNGKKAQPRNAGPARRQARYRRKLQWSRYMQWGCGPCRAIKSKSPDCPFYRSPEDCHMYRRFNRDPRIRLLPVCTKELEALTTTADDLTQAGLPGSLSMMISSALLRGNMNPELHHEVGIALKTANSYLMECRRLQSRALPKPNGKPPAVIGGDLLAPLLAARNPNSAIDDRDDEEPTQ